MKLTVDPEFKSLIPPLTHEELAQLESNIRAEGCRDSLVAWRGTLIDGHNRHAICERFQIEFAVSEMEFSSRNEVMAWIIRNQLGRRNLSTFTRAELGLKLEALVAPKARENQAKAGGDRKSESKSLYQNSGKAIHVDKEVAKAANLSHDTIHKAKKIIEKAPEPVKEALRRGEKSINEVHKEIRQQEKREKKEEVAAKISAEPPPLPIGPFRVLVVDPPWQYDGRAEDPTHRSANPYPSMPLDAIKALEVDSLAHDDCVLWLWTTNAHMRAAFEVLDAWGFTHKTILTWVKDRMGTGDWLRGQTEHCLMAVRGKPTVTLTNQTTVILGPLREHSRKPDEFYALVEKLCPGSKAELFSRQPRPGWGQHGGEKGRFLPE